MKKKTIISRLLSLVLVLVMVCAMLPSNAYAATGHQISIKIYKATQDSSLSLGYTYEHVDTIVTTCTDGTSHSGYNHFVPLKDLHPSKIGLSTDGWKGWVFDLYYSGQDGNKTFYDWTSDKVNATANVTGSEPYPCSKNMYLVYEASKPDVTYTLNYDLHGGKEAADFPSQSATNNTGSATFTIHSDEPTKDGHDFQGWSTTVGGSVEYQPGGSITITTNTTLYAVWEQHEHEDTDGDGYCDDDKTCMHEKDDDGNCVVDGCDHPETCCPKPDVTYTLSYDLQGGKEAADFPSQSAANNTGSATFTIHSGEPTKDGHDFQGWSTTVGGSVEYQPGGSITITTNTTLYAVWEQHEHEDTDGDGYCDDDKTCMHEKDDDGNCVVDGCDHPETCCPKPEVEPEHKHEDKDGDGYCDEDGTCMHEKDDEGYCTVEDCNHPETCCPKQEVKPEHKHEDKDGDGYCDEDGTCMHEKDDSGKCVVDGCDHPENCCPKPEVKPEHKHEDKDGDGYCDDDKTCMHDKDDDGKCVVDGCDHPEKCCPKAVDNDAASNDDAASDDAATGATTATVAAAAVASDAKQDSVPETGDQNVAVMSVYAAVIVVLAVVAVILLKKKIVR